MRILFLHSDFLEVKVKRKALKEPEKIYKKEYRFEEPLVCFICVEKEDKRKENLVKIAIKNIEEINKKIKAKRIILYPFVHLTNNPSDPGFALKVLKEIEERLKEKSYEVYRIPFGWYKEFTIKVKGHPLAELSRTI